MKKYSFFYLSLLITIFGFSYFVLSQSLGSTSTSVEEPVNTSVGSAVREITQPSENLILLPSTSTFGQPMERGSDFSSVPPIPLPDENQSDDAIVQLNNLIIRGVVKNQEGYRAVFLVTKYNFWTCKLFESEESNTSVLCPLPLRTSLKKATLTVAISNDTILLDPTRRRLNLDDFKTGDVVNVYGFMERDNHAINALIVRKIRTVVLQNSYLPVVKPMPVKPVNPVKPIVPVGPKVPKVKRLKLPTSTATQPILKVTTGTSYGSLGGYLTAQGASIYMWGTHVLKVLITNSTPTSPYTTSTSRPSYRYYLVKAADSKVLEMLKNNENKDVVITGRYGFMNLEGGFWFIIAENVEEIPISTTNTSF